MEIKKRVRKEVRKKERRFFEEGLAVKVEAVRALLEINEEKRLRV